MDSQPNHQLNNCQFGWRPNSLANMCLSISRSPDDAVMLSGLKIHVLTKASSVLSMKFNLACSLWQNGEFTTKTKACWILLFVSDCFRFSDRV